ncbi:unnamed protein product [Mytilus coruscus]|uniref:Ig-like domain-containing protein n=1 Tax=Mytilus coruscus TaxID=42192 RepID=A0A6J8B4R7_MYTCO|nr:unnamed protein product [Mytilus coruscus]
MDEFENLHENNLGKYWNLLEDLSKDKNKSTSPDILFQASIGSSVTLACTVSGAPLYWYVIGKFGARTINDSNQYEDFTTNYLKIKSLTTYTAATYYCQLTDGTKGPDIIVSITYWSTWTAWGDCNTACGTGKRERTRICSGNCTGEAVQRETCTVEKVDGGWSNWFTSGPCTGSCGSVSQKRIRHCDNPHPENCGVNCQGKNYSYIPCLLSACPVNGAWSSWNSWETCTVTCGTGQHSRRRHCNNPPKANGGDNCQGEEYDNNSCTLSPCAVDEKWSSWNPWEDCNETCGIGQKRKSRNCDSSTYANGGVSCEGEAHEFNSCSLSACACIF